MLLRSGLATGVLLKEDLGLHPINDGFIKVSEIIPNAISGINNLARLDWWRERIRNTFAAGERAGWKWSA